MSIASLRKSSSKRLRRGHIGSGAFLPRRDGEDTIELPVNESAAACGARSKLLFDCRRTLLELSESLFDLLSTDVPNVEPKALLAELLQMDVDLAIERNRHHRFVDQMGQHHAMQATCNNRRARRKAGE